MRKIDIHIARAFLVPFAVITASCLGLYMVVDALGDLDDFLSASDSFGQLISRMARAYLARAPVFLTPLVPMTILVSAAFAIAHMARNNEITALKASGISVHRILVPIFVCATILSLLGFANQEFVVPTVELRALAQMKLWKGQKEQWDEVPRHIESEDAIFTGRYNVLREQMLRPEVFLGHGRNVTHIKAAYGIWEAGKGWILKDATITKPAESAEHADTWLWRTALTPTDLATEILPPSSRPLRVILREKSGTRSAMYTSLLYSRLSYPLVAVALLLTGVPFMLRHESVRRSRLFGAALCIVIGGAYYTVTFMCTALGQDGSLPGAVAGLLPIFLFAAIGVYLTDRVRT